VVISTGPLSSLARTGGEPMPLTARRNPMLPRLTR
jgi:hypothetical protein